MSAKVNDVSDSDLTALEAFRLEARDWLEANYPDSLRGGPDLTMELIGGLEPTGDLELWRQRMAGKGWGTPTWPVKYGGGGLSARQGTVLTEEMARIGAYNPIFGMGPGMLGSTLLEFGTEEQKLRHLPLASRGESRWCQGFSEPGSGSDLASLSTKAEDMGDHWLINGQKIWTSRAQFADWCFCLCRTDPSAKKQSGISFILVPMNQPGVDARPIRMISGETGQCETFFTDAIARKDDLVGPLNGGWSIAKRLLQHERSGIGGRSTEGVREVINLAEMAKARIGVDEQGRVADLDLRSRITAHKMEDRAFSQTLVRASAEAKATGAVSTATSIMKNASTKLWQERCELSIEILGAAGLGWEGEGFDAADLEIVREWLVGKAGTIYGGTREVQNNIIAKRILGLPEPAGSAA